MGALGSSKGTAKESKVQTIAFKDSSHSWSDISYSKPGKITA
jgi:hypothetical protein